MLPAEWPGSYYIGDEELSLVSKCVTSRSPYRNYGPDVQHYCDQVEDFYRKRLGRKYAQLVSSGTAALSTAFMACDVGPGDEVLMPAYLWVACLSAAVRLGAIPRIVEIDDSFCMDLADLERKLNPRVKVVLYVHMSGSSGDIESVARVCRERRVQLVEDVAQSNGASYRGRPLGSFGDVAIFSFQFNKNITSGEGGLVVTDSQELFEKINAAHDTGYVRDGNGRVVPSESPVQGWGQCVHMSDLAAAMLLAQCRKLDAICAAMRARALQLAEGLARIPGVSVRRLGDPAGHSGNFVIATFPTQERCESLVARTRARGLAPPAGCLSNISMHQSWGLHLYYHNVALVRKIGVNSAGRPWSDPLNAFHASISYDRGACPVSDDLFARSVLIAVPPCLTEEQVQLIIEIYAQEAAK